MKWCEHCQREVLIKRKKTAKFRDDEFRCGNCHRLIK